MAILKTTITVVVLHESGKKMPHPENLSLRSIAEEMSDGLFVGTIQSTETVKLRKRAVADELIAVGSDESFFDLS